jgi:integrase
MVRKGATVVTIPLAPRTARAIDLAIGERVEGAIFAARTVNGSTATPLADRAPPRPHGRHQQAGRAVRHAFITAALDAGVPLRDVREAASHADPRTTMRYDRARVSLDRHATYIVAAFLAGAAR